MILNIECRTVQAISFGYLGGIVNEDGRNDAEMRSTIATGKVRFGQMKRILINISLSTGMQLKIFKCCIWLGLLCGYENRTISKEVGKRME